MTLELQLNIYLKNPLNYGKNERNLHASYA